MILSNKDNTFFLYTYIFINFHRTCSGKHMSIWICYMNIYCTIDILFKNTCYEMALNWQWYQYKSPFFFSFNNRVWHKLDISRHRIVGTHHVQYLTLKTPEQTKQRPASLGVESFRAKGWFPEGKSRACFEGDKPLSDWRTMADASD